MKFLKKNEIDKGFANAHRTYLCGNLKNETKSDFILTDNYEIGITEYKEFTSEKPHYHSSNNEFNYVIEGSVKVLLINDKREMLFKTGDLFVITPNEPYICKGLSGTRIIFSKVPGGNDKVQINITAPIANWCKNWETQYVE